MHVLAKPIGSVCDIACDYCFYLEKRELYPRGEHFKMPDEVLAKYIEQYVESQPYELPTAPVRVTVAQLEPPPAKPAFSKFDFEGRL